MGYPVSSKGCKALGCLLYRAVGFQPGHGEIACLCTSLDERSKADLKWTWRVGFSQDARWARTGARRLESRDASCEGPRRLNWIIEKSRSAFPDRDGSWSG